jgi:hypothetical protein
MPASRYLLLAFVGVLALLITTTWTRAQTQRWTPLTEPVVVSGTAMGFRIEWMHGRTPVGAIVVRIDGQWIEARVGSPSDRQLIPPPPPAPPPPR